jgi:hypothetical protein
MIIIIIIIIMPKRHMGIWSQSSTILISALELHFLLFLAPGYGSPL